VLKKDIITSNLEHVDANELRCLFYLSTHNSWVNVAGDLFKIKINHIVETIETEIGSMVYFSKKFHPVSASDELDLKILISRFAISAFVSAVSSSGGQIDATGSNELPDLSLNAIQKTFTNICFNLGDRRIALSIELYNFDHEFANKLNTITSVEEKKSAILEYQNCVNTAQKSAVANAVWMAAAAGDYEQLLLLLNETKDFDINQNYDDCTIIEAMFNANPKLDLPLKSTQPDYKKTIELLLNHGLDKQLVAFASQKYQTMQNNLWFFQRYNPVHKNILSILISTDNARENGIEHVVESKNSCAIQ
jgi:hypothetical protein